MKTLHDHNKCGHALLIIITQLYTIHVHALQTSSDNGQTAIETKDRRELDKILKITMLHSGMYLWSPPASQDTAALSESQYSV